MTKLDDKTTISLFAAIASLPFLIGAIMWLTSIDSKASQALREVSKIDKLQESVTRLEIKFGTLPDKKQNYQGE